jgi:hypothetical protein
VMGDKGINRRKSELFPSQRCHPKDVDDGK